MIWPLYLALAVAAVTYAVLGWLVRERPHPEPEGRAIEALARIQNSDVPVRLEAHRDVCNPYQKVRL